MLSSDMSVCDTSSSSIPKCASRANWLQGVCYTASSCINTFQVFRVVAYSGEYLMINPGDREKDDQRRWQARFARGRQGLSASVEEALANPNLSEEDFDDDLEDGSLEQVETDKVKGQSNQMLIRPRSSLQSKPLPIVRVPRHTDDRQVAQDSTPAVATNGTTKAAQPCSPA